MCSLNISLHIFLVVVMYLTVQQQDLWAQYENTNAQLFQVQLRHEARPNVC